MLTSYEKKQKEIVRKWKYTPLPIIMQSWDIVFLPTPDVFIEHLPYDSLETVLEMSILQPIFQSDKEKLLSIDHLSLSELKSKGLQFSDTLFAKIYGEIKFSELTEKQPCAIMEFLLDIPDVVSSALRLIHKVGICYGYELGTLVDKNYGLAALGSINGDPQAQAAEFSPAMITNLHPRQLAAQIGAEIGMRKFIVQNPYLNIFVGKSTEKWYLKDVGLAAQRVFQKRWLIDNSKWD